MPWTRACLRHEFPNKPKKAVQKSSLRMGGSALDRGSLGQGGLGKLKLAKQWDILILKMEDLLIKNKGFIMCCVGNQGDVFL